MLVSIVQQSESAIHTHVSSQQERSYFPVGRNIASWESQSIACWVHGLGFSMVQDKPQTQPTPVQTPQIQWFYWRTWACVHLLLENSKVQGKVHWKFKTGGGVLKILTFSFPSACVPLIKCAQNPIEGFRCVLLGWGSCFLQTPGGAIEPPCPNSSVSHPHHPQSPGWQGQATKFKRSFTPPFPHTRPLPSACSETSARAILGAPVVPAPGFHSIPASPDLSWPLSSHTLGIWQSCLPQDHSAVTFSQRVFSLSTWHRAGSLSKREKEARMHRHASTHGEGSRRERPQWKSRPNGNVPQVTTAELHTPF